jgi:flagellar hook-associated protein 2
MAGIQLSGLASGFDWKSLVDQLMQVEATPITRIQKEQSTNTQRNTALDGLGTKLDALRTAATALKDTTLFAKRTAASGTANSTWKVSAASGFAPGSHTIAVSQLATAARREGGSDITGGLSATDDVSGTTLATLGTAATITAGTFSVNGQKVTIATTDSLADVFSAISSATSGAVTAAYDSSTDKVTLTGTGAITLGAANDTSNFLAALKLGNNGGASVTSSGTLGAMRPGATLAAAGLRTAVGGTGAGSFTINGVSIAYNTATDTLSTLLKRVNASGAGVTASYDAVNDRVVMANRVTGDLGISVTDDANGLLSALGLTTAATAVAGEDAAFTVDGGATLYSRSNTLDAAAHGLSGLSVTVDSETTQTVTVAADTGSMRSRISDFVDAYNAVQSYIDDKTKITTSAGKVTTSVLSANREVQSWAHELRSLAFGTISSGGTVNRLEKLGLDFTSTGALKVGDEEKLTTALTENSTDVEAFFTTGTTGFAAKFDKLLGSLTDAADSAQKALTKTNSSLDTQIADLQRRLDQQRELLTSSFLAMESAQARIQQQSTALTNAFASSSSSSGSSK